MMQSVNESYQHISVLLDESIEQLNIKPGGTYIDVTFGGGGHSRAILSKLGEKGRLIAMDHDEDAWQNEIEDKRFTLVKANFRYLGHFLDYMGVKKVDGILGDLGVSSHHFDTASRGFSIRYDGPLDMRMDSRLKMTAEDVINNYDANSLIEIFEKYGQVRNTKTLVKTIEEKRKGLRIRSIESLKKIIASCVKGNEQKYLAQVFQAIRIEVNSELKVLESFLESTIPYLNKGGRFCMITFHSLEDRIVKQFMKNGGLAEIKTDEFGRKMEKPKIKALIDITPSMDEQKQNSRSRSARLRVAEKL